jgi:hypothetical protein
MTPDSLRDMLAEALYEHRGDMVCFDHPEDYCCTRGEHRVGGYREHLIDVLERLIADARTEGRALGRFETTTGHKPEPRDPNYQAGYSAGRAEQAAADRARVEALADEWESRAANARSCAEARLGLSDAEGLHAHADLMQRRADDLRAALDSEGGVT